MSLLLRLLPLVLICSPLQAGFDHSHSLFTEVLKTHVSGNDVDYAALKKSPGKLESYLQTLGKVPESSFDDWTEKQQTAFLINLYNAATLKLVIEAYPVDSIRDIAEPWKQEHVNAFGRALSLDHLEHGILRKNYNEPRIHFGLNCASVGCPALRAEAFRADILDRQLDEQARAFLNEPSKNRVDLKTETLHLSPIFEWFEEDFVKSSGSVQNFVAPYFHPSLREALKSKPFQIKYTAYDWTLNQK